MKKLKKILLYISLFIFGIGIVFAADNYFRSGENWDANVATSNSANDVWTFTGRLDLEDSRSYNYINNGYRGKLTGWIRSNLFGDYKTNNQFTLKLKCKYTDSTTCKNEIKNKCLGGSDWDGNGPVPEIYTLNGSIISDVNGENLWGDFDTDDGGTNISYFCSNKIIYAKLVSERIGEKEIGNTFQTINNDVFGKQEIYIHGIANINGNTDNGILSRGDQEINKVSVYVGENAKIKRNLNKQIYSIYKSYINSPGNLASGDTIENFNNSRDKEHYYIYNYSGDIEDIVFNGNTYINRGKKLIIDESNSDNITDVSGINTVIVQGGNVYIKSDIKNTDDSKDLLILIAKRDNTTKNGGNIYIDPSVTNIDAVLIADGSLLSLGSNNILYVKDSNQVNSIRKQLLIYGRLFSSNNVGLDKMPFGADLYQDSSYTNNEMDGNIYDLGNLRTFNLNYGGGDGVISGCNDPNKLTPIQTFTKSWAGRRNCYIGDSTNNGLRGSYKLNPLIIENNTHIPFLDPYVLRK